MNDASGSAVAVSLTGDGNANVLTGGTAADTIVGGAGIDTLSGGLGNDTITYDGLDVSIAGGDDIDTLVVNGAATINLANGDQSSGDTAAVSGFENVDASGSSAAVDYWRIKRSDEINPLPYNEAAALPTAIRGDNNLTINGVVVPNTGTLLRPGVFQFAIMPTLSVGKGSYTRPQFRLVYAVSALNEGARDLYPVFANGTRDSRANSSTQHLLGIMVEWWFQGSYRY